MRIKILFSIFIVVLFLITQPVHGQVQPVLKTRHFDFIPEQSKVTFSADSTLHSFSGTAKEIEGFAEGDVDHFGEIARGILKIKVKGMTTDYQMRDGYMVGDLEEEKYPFIIFSLKSAKLSSLSQDKLKAKMALAGELDLHGVKKEIEIPAEVILADGRIYIKGKKELSLKDFGIKPTSFLFLRVSDKVVVEFDVVGKRNALPVEETRKAN